MIVAERKPIDEIYAMLKPFDKVLVVGCGGCVTVCLTGGERSVAVLAEQLRLKDNLEGGNHTFTECTITRQCDAEYVEEIRSQAADADVVLSMACGVGVNYMTEVLGGPVILPAMNTVFMGANIAQGQWSERCAGCGDCMLEKTGGICPIARCSKSLMNGPCGGTDDGKCEVGCEIDCGWALIVQRMTDLGRLDELTEVMPPRDWSTSRDGGPRRMTVEGALLPTDADSDDST
jgi:ferredoxin